jgi:nucleotide-binding universal stress UspA family protein
MLNHILVPLDGSSLAERTLPHVVALARVFDAQITLLQVVSQEDPDLVTDAVSPLDWQIRRAEAKAYIQDVVNRLEKLELHVEGVVLEGQAAKDIIEFAHSNDVDLIVLSSHGRSGLSEWGISSIVQKVALRAHVPIYIVRAYAADSEDLEGLTYRQILVPLDGSQRAECAISAAEELSRAFDAGLLLAHVVRRPEVPRRAPLSDKERDLVERLIEVNLDKAKQYMADVKAHSIEGTEVMVRVADSSALELHRIVEERQVDLMVLSAHGYSGEPRWPYGSISLNLIFYGTSALLIVQDIAPGEIKPSQAELASKEKRGH